MTVSAAAFDSQVRTILGSDDAKEFTEVSGGVENSARQIIGLMDRVQVGSAFPT